MCECDRESAHPRTYRSGVRTAKPVGDRMPACEATDSVPAYPPSFAVEEQSWEAPLRHGSAATSSASMMSQSDLSKMQYDRSAPTIATRQLPRSGFVQAGLCRPPNYAERLRNDARLSRNFRHIGSVPFGIVRLLTAL